MVKNDNLLTYVYFLWVEAGWIELRLSVISLYPFYRWGNQSSERFNSFPQIPQLLIEALCFHSGLLVGISQAWSILPRKVRRYIRRLEFPHLSLSKRSLWSWWTPGFWAWLSLEKGECIKEVSSGPHPGALHAGEWPGKAEGEGLLLSSNGRVSSLAPQAMPLTGETTLSQLPGAVEDKWAN